MIFENNEEEKPIKIILSPVHKLDLFVSTYMQKDFSILTPIYGKQ
jgi:hypothetical protein